MTVQALSLSQLTGLIGKSINVQPALKQVWVTAETSEVRVSGGHCYMELIEKDSASGKPVARLRAVIWANNYQRIGRMFRQVTGMSLASDMKIMANVTVNYHPVYGLSAVIEHLNCEYTLGARMRRRMEILARLEEDGVLEMNRTLEMPVPTLRVAVISSPTAAGFGDFIHQIFANPRHLNFRIRLFEAVMQGQNTPGSVISALERVMACGEDFDCLAILRGGGAVADLDAFDDYSLALNVAQFPLPVITAIGHERDTTVLDHIARVSVKTPTAAAEWLIREASEQLDRVLNLGSEISMICRERISGEEKRLAFATAQIPLLAHNATAIRRERLSAIALSLPQIPRNIMAMQLQRLDRFAESLRDSLPQKISSRRQRLDALESLVSALSPEAVLRRGYSITLREGKPLMSASELREGEEITTILAEGRISSKVKEISDKND